MSSTYIWLSEAPGEAPGKEESSNFLIPNGTFFVELIIFLVVLFVIWRFVVPSIREVLDQREEMVAQTARDNHEAAKNFAAAEADYRKELADARSEAGRIRDEARGEGQKILDGMRSQARRESDAIQQEAATELQRHGDEVAAQLRSNIDPLADQLADKVLGRTTAKKG